MKYRAMSRRAVALCEQPCGNCGKGAGGHAVDETEIVCEIRRCRNKRVSERPRQDEDEIQLARTHTSTDPRLYRRLNPYIWLPAESRTRHIAHAAPCGRADRLELCHESASRLNSSEGILSRKATRILLNSRSYFKC